MNDDAITLRFTSQQLDHVVNVLAQRPYAEVQTLIATISQQVAMHNAERNAPKVSEAKGTNGAEPLPAVPMQ